jgi:hypothetical protein
MISIKYSIKSGIIAFFILVTPPGFTETGKSRHFNLGGGWALSGMRDEGLSPLYYSGNHIYASSGLRSSTDTRMLFADIGFITGIISPAINPELTDSHMRNVNLQLNVAHLRQAGEWFNDYLSLFLGGSIGSEFAYYRHNQFINNSITVYSVNSLNLDTRVSYRFSVNQRGYLIALRAYMPVVSFLIRPDFAYIMPSGFLDHSTGNLKSLINSLEITSLNRFFSLHSNLSFEYTLSNRNALRVQYKWQFSNHRNQNRLTSATHGIMLQTMFNF